MEKQQRIQDQKVNKLFNVNYSGNIIFPKKKIRIKSKIHYLIDLILTSALFDRNESKIKKNNKILYTYKNYFYCYQF